MHKRGSVLIKTLVDSPNVIAVRSASECQERSRTFRQLMAVDRAPILCHSLEWVGATANGQLVGFVKLAWDGGAHAFLLDTTVHADYQRQGLGQALVEEAAALARARGAVWLHVDFEEELDPFYRACGFRPTAAGLRDLTVP